MKAVLFGILSLGTVALTSSAWADDHHHNGGGGNHESHHSNGGGGHESHSSEHMRFHGDSSREVVHEHFSGHHDNVRITVHPSHNFSHVTVHGTHHGVIHGHVNAARFHHVFRAPHRYRIGFWHAPRGFTYRRFGIGERIPALLLVPEFFLLDYYDYGLDEPDDGYVWVRDGYDAVLVDRYTGEVVEVEYDVFY